MSTNDPRHYDVIVSPVVTEKSTMASEQNQVVFNVARKATKPEIKAAIEALFSVKVTGVNTMPRKTMDAFADHGWVNTESIIGLAAESQEIFDKLVAVGVDLTDVFLVLENEGVSKFEDAWNDLLSATAEQLSAANKG